MELQTLNNGLTKETSYQILLKECSSKDSLKLSEIILSKSQSLAEVKKTLGEEKTRALVVLLVNELVNSFNVGKTMNAAQVIDCSNLIMKTYYYFKIPDFKLCFERIKAGYYGKAYDRIDANVILDWIGYYDSERTQEVERIRTTESQRGKVYSRVLPDVFAKIKLPEFKPEIKKEAPKETKSRDIVQSWMKQFDKIYYRQDDGSGGMRFIKRYGKTLDMNDFLKYKMNQYNRVKENLI